MKLNATTTPAIRFFLKDALLWTLLFLGCVVLLQLGKSVASEAVPQERPFYMMLPLANFNADTFASTLVWLTMLASFLLVSRRKAAFADGQELPLFAGLVPLWLPLWTIATFVMHFITSDLGIPNLWVVGAGTLLFGMLAWLAETPKTIWGCSCLLGLSIYGLAFYNLQAMEQKQEQLLWQEFCMSSDEPC